ncbi:hypothetical protein [Chryseobacterium indologenes]|uniref:Lipoprotein n=1 Tax=Chryseobacterium indologenes TaxID=253 RepID=A0A0N0IYI9_CHRID|nr:hypothetical protein [Chryseobacterium indologenes]KPE53154.1 hypothetical protein AOB46_04000 [Chryseobacterium indologenes]
MKNTFLLLILVLGLLSCENKVESVEKAFYYWKSDGYSFSEKEKEILKNHEIKKLYVKFFEVDYSEAMGNFPVSKTNFSYYSCCNGEKAGYSIIPVVYIKNIVFQKSSEKELDQLADNVNYLVDKYAREKIDSLQVSEIQIDCDWTESTKNNYFYFLKKLKPVSKKQISATLRLYPYKYPGKMGIPPVDKVTLMCYNLINPFEDKSKNSILDLKELESYLRSSKKYPLHLDIALPVYSWMQIYQNNRFTGIIYNGNQLKKSLKTIKPMWYEVTKDTAVDYQTYLRVGDKIKYEEITADKINQAIDLIKKHVKFDKNITVTLFHLDENQLNNYTDEEISRFYSRFAK